MSRPEIEALANAIDLLLRCPVLLQLGPCPLDGLLQRLRRVRPMMQGRPEAVVLARLVDALVELRGLDRCLQHQAAEMLHLEPAGRARQVPLPRYCSGRRPM